MALTKTTVNRIIPVALSNFDLDKLYSDINNMIGGSNSINIFTVPDMIKHPKLFKDQLKKNHYAVLFIEPNGAPIGHWIVMFKNSGGKNFLFDSYGEEMDELDNRLKPFFKKYYPTLKYNRFQYQQYNPNVATCGRYSMFVIALNKMIKNLDLEKINQVFEFLKKGTGKGYDFIVSNFVNLQI